MNRLPYVTALISVTATVALWLIATWLEGDTPGLASSPELGPGIAHTRIRPDSAVQVSPDVTGCDQAEETLRAEVDAAKYCSTDDDCTLFDYGYPIQCLTSVAKSDITMLRLAYRNYQQSCAFRVYYDCPTGRMKRQAVCRNNRCTVELQSTEFLEEKTLDYLGLNPR